MFCIINNSQELYVDSYDDCKKFIKEHPELNLTENNIHPDYSGLECIY